MKLKRSDPQAPAMSEHEVLERKFQLARKTLLLIVAFSALNLLMLILGNDSYLIFSASVPYYLVLYARIFSGNVPEAWGWGDMSDSVIFGQSAYVAAILVAVLLIAVYALFWFLSKRSAGWLNAALVCFCLDTVGLFLLAGFSLSMLLDAAFHALIIFELVIGVRAAKKWKDLPPEENPFAYPEENIDSPSSEG